MTHIRNDKYELIPFFNQITSEINQCFLPRYAQILGKAFENVLWLSSWDVPHKQRLLVYFIFRMSPMLAHGHIVNKGQKCPSKINVITAFVLLTLQALAYFSF